jgi:RNA ligase
MSERTKYPRSMHFSFSPGLQNDDRMLENGTAGWEGTEVVITEKMDGSNCTWYCDGLHGRSLDIDSHPQWDKIKAMHAEIAHSIPPGWRISGENMTAVHSIKYVDLPSIFLVYSIWDNDICLSWKETVEWCALLNLAHVPVLYLGKYSDDVCKKLCGMLNVERQEGLVVRPAGRFHFSDFPILVAKWVRENHIRSNSDHWAKGIIQFNGLKEK